MDYDGLTIYEPSDEAKRQDPLGLHAIEIVGWGKDPSSGVSYWVCRNSWGLQWPKHHKRCAGAGFFYMRMGGNGCKIEEYAAGAIPVVYNSDEAPMDEGNLYPSDRGTCAKSENNTRNITSGGSSMTMGTKVTIAGAVLGVIVVGAFAAYAYTQKKKGKRVLPFGPF